MDDDVLANVVFFGLIILLIVVYFLYDKDKKETLREKLSAMSPDERAAYDAQKQKTAAQNRMNAARMANSRVSPTMRKELPTSPPSA